MNGNRPFPISSFEDELAGSKYRVPARFDRGGPSKGLPEAFSIPLFLAFQVLSPCHFRNGMASSRAFDAGGVPEALVGGRAHVVPGIRDHREAMSLVLFVSMCFTRGPLRANEARRESSSISTSDRGGGPALEDWEISGFT